MKIFRDLAIAVVLGIIVMFLIIFARGLRDDTQTEVQGGIEETAVIEVEALGFNTGVLGTILVGPQCPVMREGEKCPNSPYVGIVDFVVNDPERELIARVRTDKTGVFAASLPAGEYVVIVQADGTFPICPEENVLVTDGEVAAVDITCDSGIR